MVVFLDAYVINVAIPAIGRSLHAGVAELQWVLTGYLVAVAALLLFAGALADHFGRRRILTVGLGVMFLASLACAVAPDAPGLIAARVVQGVGGALIVPSSLSLLNGTLASDERARGIGIWAGISTLGTTLGPYGGGWLVDHASWRYIFLLNLPLILAACVDPAQRPGEQRNSAATLGRRRRSPACPDRPRRGDLRAHGRTKLGLDVDVRLVDRPTRACLPGGIGSG